MEILELFKTCRAAISVASALKKLTKSMKRKSNQFSLRLDPELQAEVEECCRITGMEAPHFIREAFKAFVEEVRKTGEIRLPLALIPKSQLAQKAPEPRAPFHSTVVLPSPEQEAASRLNEQQEPQLAPRDAAVPNAQPKITKTRAVMRKLAQTKPQ